MSEPLGGPRVLETVLTGRNLLSPMLATAARDVAAFDGAVSRANTQVGTSATAAARAQQTAAGTITAANRTVASSATQAAASQRAAAATVEAANIRAATSATAAAATQSAATNAVTKANVAGADAAALAAALVAAANGDSAASAQAAAGAATESAEAQAASFTDVQEKAAEYAEKVKGLRGDAAESAEKEAGTTSAANARTAASSAESAAAQGAAGGRVAASNTATTATVVASGTRQAATHQATASSAVASSQVQQAANAQLAASNGLVLASMSPLLKGIGTLGLAVGYAAYRSMDFGSAMSQVQAASQASAADMELLREAAIRAGADTQYSGVEAAQGITELSKAGVSTADVLGGGLRGALNLAAAGQMEVADAAETAATALSVFQLSGDQASHVADLLAAGAGKAQGTVHDLSAALNQSALVAAQTGLSIEDTAGALAMFASNGLVGSDAGTSFKTMLQALTPNSKAAAEAMAAIGFSAYDAEGKFVGLDSVAQQLKTGLSGLTEQQRAQTLETIFGSDAVRAAAVIYKEGSTGVAEWTEKVNDAGFAQEQASQLTDNLRGDLERLGGAADATFTQLGDSAQGPLRLLAQGLTVIVDAVGVVIGAWNSLPGPVQAGALALGAFLLLRGPLDAMFTRISVGIVSTATGMGMAAAQAGVLRAAAGGLLTMFGGPLGLAITGAVVGISLLATTMGGSSDKTQDAAAATDDLTAALKETEGAINGVVRQAAAKDLQDEGLLDWAKKVGVEMPVMVDAMLGVPGAMDQVTGAFDRYANANQVWVSDEGGHAAQVLSDQGLAAADAKDQFLAMAGVLPETIAAEQEVAAAAEQTGTVMGQTTELTEEAAQALEEWLETLQNVAAGFVDPLSAYEGLVRSAATATAEATADSTDSWSDYVDTTEVSLGELADLLAQQILDQENWRTNISQIAAWAGVDVAQHLAAMGQEGVGLVAQMADGSSAEAQRMAGLIREDIRLGGMEWTAAMDTEMRNIEAISRAGAGRTVAGLAYQLGLGVDEVAAIASRYGVVLADGINPLLGALGQRTVAIQQRGARPNGGNLNRPGFSEGGYTGDGDKYEPKGVVHAGEFVVTKERTAKLGVRTLENLERILPGYADGGFVATSQVPRPPSTAPKGPPISTAGDATMRHGYDATVKWLEANLLAGGSFGPSGASPNGVGGLGPRAAAARAEIVRLFGITNIGGYANRNIAGTGTKSDHALGKAIDVMIANYRSPGGIAQGNAVASHLITNAGRLGTRYVIWRDRIHQGSGWAPYGHPGGGRSDTLQHRDHVHGSFYDRGGVAVGAGYLPKGVVAPERVLDPRQTAAFEEWMTGPRYTAVVPAAMPGYGMAPYGGGGGVGAITVQAAPVHVYLDGEQWRGMARVESSAIVVEALTVMDDQRRNNR